LTRVGRLIRLTLALDSDSLEVVRGPAAGARIEVDDELLIGRIASGDGQLGGDPELSRRHALIRRAGARLTIVDLGSLNGTRLNGQVLSGPTELCEGDRIELGGSAIEVRGAARSAVATGDTVSRTVVRERVPSGHGPERLAAPFTPPPVDRSDPGRARTGALIALSVVATVAVAAAVILLVTRGPQTVRRLVVRTVHAPLATPPFDGTAYTETNVASPDANSVLALRYRAGSFRPLQITEYPTGGSGSADLGNRGVLDADQQVIANAAGTLLFAVNQGSDSIAVFQIAADGSLTPVRGSPFASGGTAPASLGISGDILIVANKAQDGVRDLTSVQANYTTFRVANHGVLSATGSTFVLPPKSSPTQVFVAPGGRLVFATEETGLLRSLELTSTGMLIQAPGSPHPLPNSLFAAHQRPHPVWPAGLSANADADVLYSGIPNYGSIVAYDYGAGSLQLDGEEADQLTFLPCWSVVSSNDSRLYFANAGTDNISVWDIATDPRHPRLLQTVPLRGGGNPWNLSLDPSGKYLYIITPRQVRAVPPGQGQLLHSLRVLPDGRLQELPDSPVPLPVAPNTNPFGLAIVPRR
jgi:pSer/pThr/pTyr-binding forkhead associated (FHA) protein/DNA-binding beta-propeller fold protein YncE